jgi:hypothetical protein
MSRNTRIFCLFVLTLAALGGCSSQPPANESQKAGTKFDRIQGKSQVLPESGGATDAALNAGGPSVFLLEGERRYRLFLRTPVAIVPGDEYVAEGVWAQKAIDEIGDPDQGKNGYPLEPSCRRVIARAWPKLSLDAMDATVSVVRATVKRYPARALFLVARIEPAPKESGTGSAEPKKNAAAEDKKTPTVSVAADKQRASLIEGPTVQAAPLWEAAGGTVRCKVLIGPDGKISELQTGMQLCEAVQWSQFRYQPPGQGGHPVKVETEVEIRFDPRK